MRASRRYVALAGGLLLFSLFGASAALGGTIYTFEGDPIGHIPISPASLPDGFYTPPTNLVPGSVQAQVIAYSTVISYGVAADPGGGSQVLILANTPLDGNGADTQATRAQTNINFPQASEWTISYDIGVVSLSQTGNTFGTDNIGAFGVMGDSFGSFSVVNSWDSATTFTWTTSYYVYDINGNPIPDPTGIYAGPIPGPAWMGLSQDHWYRLSTTFDQTSNRIVSVSITDLTTASTTTVSPVGWCMNGGATPPGANIHMRFAGFGTTNAVMIDNVSVGSAPAAVTAFSPSQGATGVSTTAGLSWTAPTGATSYAVYFGTSSPPPLAVASTTSTTYSPTMAAGTTYYWSVTAINDFGSAPSAVWSFTTAGSPPAAVTVFFPGQGATGIPINQALMWTAPTGASTYNLYFGTSSPPPLLAPSLVTTGYSPTMTAGTTYYWSVTAINSSGSTPSAIWSFTTAAAGSPPAAVTVFSPTQGAAAVPVTTSLTWTPPSGASTYNLYFGTTSPPPLLAPSLVTAGYSPTMTVGTTYYWSVTAINAYGSTPSAVWSFTTATATVSGYRFVPVTPCRVLDTRNATGTFGGPIIGAASTRTVPIPQSACNIPSTAQAYSLNITVVPPGPLAYLTAWPAGQSQPVVSTLNSYDGRIVANAAIVPAGANQGIEFYASDATHVIADINGYFAPLSTSNSMSFYAATPCRVVDTRNSNGAFGGPFLGAGSTRSFAIPSSACGIPATAQAYSLNVTVAPHGGLGYLTLWPAGQTQPYVSTLNSPDGSVVANAAIVPAGTPNGSVSVFVTDATDVIIDINGYFAPPGSANALSLYTLTPCRVADTRQAAGAFGGPSLGAGGTRSFALASSACNVPIAPAYSLNVTVVPPAPLAYLTAWPTGQTQPYVSTLNSYAGKVVANAAIVPAGANGGVSVFVSDATNVILDINAYFAQ